jgi:hypothetical protein
VDTLAAGELADALDGLLVELGVSRCEKRGAAGPERYGESDTA